MAATTKRLGCQHLIGLSLSRGGPSGRSREYFVMTDASGRVVTTSPVPTGDAGGWRRCCRGTMLRLIWSKEDVFEGCRRRDTVSGLPTLTDGTAEYRGTGKLRFSLAELQVSSEMIKDNATEGSSSKRSLWMLRIALSGSGGSKWIAVFPACNTCPDTHLIHHLLPPPPPPTPVPLPSLISLSLIVVLGLSYCPVPCVLDYSLSFFAVDLMCLFFVFIFVYQLFLFIIFL